MSRPHYRQRTLFEEDPTLVTSKAEDQWFDRKSVRVDAATLANLLVGFANADGGTILIGVENDGSVAGVDGYPEQVNRLRQAAIDFTTPPVRHTIDVISCVNAAGESDHLLVIEVHPSEQLHRNNRGDVYKRIGDQTRKLSGEAERELAFDKGEHPFDAGPVPHAALVDLDLAAVRAFARIIGVGEDIERALRVRGLAGVRDGQPFLTWGAVLLFGLNPQSFVPGAFLRVLRYDGVRARTGTRSNLVFDRRLDGPLPAQIEAAREVMLNQVRQVIRLDEETGQFVAIAEVPRFAWLEAIVNAVTHRSYSLQGDHIRVLLFDDRIEVESPGRLPGPVRIDNIRQTRFSRNPRISRTLADLKVVQELNEGMNRMFDEMSTAGLPEPLLHQTDAGFRVTLYNSNQIEREQVRAMVTLVPDLFAPALDRLFSEGQIATGEAASLTGLSLPTVRRYLRSLEQEGLLTRIARSTKDPHAFWRPLAPFRSKWRVATVLEANVHESATRNN